MKIRDLILHLTVLLVLSACASGSGRQGTQINVTGSAPTAQVLGGSNVVFVMTVTNAGPFDASNIKLVDNVGNQLKLLSITCAATGGATCPSAPSVEMVIPTLPNGGSLIFSVTTQLDSGATGVIENSMTSSFAEEIDPTGDSAVATANASSIVTNVVVSGTGPTGTVVGGSAAVFVMTVTNNGPDAATNFNVYDNVGNGVTLTGITCAASGGAVCPATVGVLTAVDTLPSGGVLTFTVHTQIGQNVNGTVTNQLVADIKTNPTQSADSFYATATVITADLSVTGTPPAGPLLPGSAASFTMVVTNNGPGTSLNIDITNALSTNITASGAITCVAAGGAACPTTLGPAMTLASMPDAGALTFTVPFTVNAGASGAVTDTMTVTSTTDARGPQTATVGVGAGSSFVTVTETGTSTVGAGTNAVFTAVVGNTGPAVATNIAVNEVLTVPAGSGITLLSVTCAAASGIICPASLGASMVIPSLGVGRAMNFTYTVLVPAAAAGLGPIINTVTASAIGNADTTQNSASYSTQPINAYDGTYQLFAGNGYQYTMVANFGTTTGTYTITGNGANISESFTADATGGGYTVVNGGPQFRVGTDVIVGGQDFGQGVIPYIAARVFGTTVQQLAGTSGGTYNFMTIGLLANNGGAVTAANTASVSGNILAICQTSTSNITVMTTQNCPAAWLQTYALSVDGNVFTATNTNTAGIPKQFTFEEAQIGATTALLGANQAPNVPAVPAGVSQQLIIGLPDAKVIAGGSSQGESVQGTVHEWITAALTSSSYGFSGSSYSDSVVLGAAPAGGPFSMLIGDLATTGQPIYVMQSYPISVAFGAVQGSASGLLQVTIP